MVGEDRGWVELKGRRIRVGGGSCSEKDMRVGGGWRLGLVMRGARGIVMRIGDERVMMASGGRSWRGTIENRWL